MTEIFEFSTETHTDESENPLDELQINGRRRRAFAWNYFRRMADGKSCCIKCTQEYAAGCSTSTLENHLLRQHGIVRDPPPAPTVTQTVIDFSPQLNPQQLEKVLKKITLFGH